MINKNRIFVAGHRGMVGGALVRLLRKDPFNEIITADRSQLDLLNQAAVQTFFALNRFDQVFLAAAKVGGIHANNTYPADFIYENLVIQTNVIHAAHIAGVQKLLFLGSSCVYPKYAEQPMAESALLTGSLEPTNEPYAIAKIAGIKMCESYNRQHGRDYRSVMPTNLYGPGDNFHPENSHVIPGLIYRFHHAKEEKKAFVDLWGTGNPRREFLYIDDMVDGVLTIMSLEADDYKKQIDPMLSHINLGCGIDFSIKELVKIIGDVVGYRGIIRWDCTKPDGTKRKLLDVSKLSRMGWEPKMKLKEGVINTYNWYLNSKKKSGE